MKEPYVQNIKNRKLPDCKIFYFYFILLFLRYVLLTGWRIDKPLVDYFSFITTTQCWYVIINTIYVEFPKELHFVFSVIVILTCWTCRTRCENFVFDSFPFFEKVFQTLREIKTLQVKGKYKCQAKWDRIKTVFSSSSF